LLLNSNEFAPRATWLQIDGPTLFSFVNHIPTCFDSLNHRFLKLIAGVVRSQEKSIRRPVLSLNAHRCSPRSIARPTSVFLRKIDKVATHHPKHEQRAVSKPRRTEWPGNIASTLVAITSRTWRNLTRHVKPKRQHDRRRLIDGLFDFCLQVCHPCETRCRQVCAHHRVKKTSESQRAVPEQRRKSAVPKAQEMNTRQLSRIRSLLHS
jgi:hypothetical protein